MTSSMFAELMSCIDGDVCDDLLYTSMLATDGSIFYRKPLAVVYPANDRDVIRTVRFARSRGWSVHPRGAGSGLCGSAIGPGIVIDFTRYMNRLLNLDTKAKTFTCEPGFRLGELEAVLTGKGLFFPPDPSSGEYATFGGMFSTNASGAHSVKYGNVADYVVDAHIVLGSGRLIRLSHIQATDVDQLPHQFRQLHRMYVENAGVIESAYPDIACNVSGYYLRGLVDASGHLNLRRLFAGAEGTLGIVTRLTFKLLDKPTFDSLVVAYFDDIVSSARAVGKILPMEPSGIEIMDKSLMRLAREMDDSLRDQIPDGVDNVLMIEFDGMALDSCEAMAHQAKSLLEQRQLSREAHIAVSETEKARFWGIRKAAVPILYRLKGAKKILALVEDAAVPTQHLEPYFKGLYEIFHRHQVAFVLYGHIAKGLLHTRPLLDLKQERDVELLKTLADEVFELVHQLGGTVSGEHGDGRLRSPFIKRQYPTIHDLFVKTRQIIDPHGMFNPEIITVDDPDQMKKHLRYGTDYQTRPLGPNRLLWQEGFYREVEKCHGCAKCTTITKMTRMCPVYKFTRDEAAAPRAKANVLRELIRGTIPSKWLFHQEFQRVMALCIQCGSCAHECPSAVNIPKMAMEARARYLEMYGPSLQSRILTSAETAGRFATSINGMFQSISRFPPARQLAQSVLGISAQRRLMPFARRSLFQQVPAIHGDGRAKVLYFSGCYAGYVRPEIGRSMVRVLTRLGLTVVIPDQHCCGLPMLSKGMVPQARQRIKANLEKWAWMVSEVDHIVVTCSSCGYALMAEWTYVENHPVIRSISEKTIHASRLVGRYINRLDETSIPARVAYHTPCHLKIQPEPGASLDMISHIRGIQVAAAKTHCCGMAGTWGMSADNFPLSIRIGMDLIRTLETPDTDCWVTDCPTCEMQLSQISDKPVCHPMEVAALTLDHEERDEHSVFCHLAESTDIT